MERERELVGNGADPLIGMKALVVEDNELNLEIVTEVLRGARSGRDQCRKWPDSGRSVFE